METEKTPYSFHTRFYRRLFRHKRPVLAGLAAALVLLLYSASGLRLKENIMDLLPSGDPMVKKYQELLTGFHRLDFLFIVVGPESSGLPVSREELITVADEIADRLSSSPLFKEVHYKWDMGDLSSAMDILREYRASLFTSGDRKIIEEKLTGDSIRKALTGWKRMLTESPAPMLAASFRRDPLAMDLILLNKLKTLRSMGTPMKIEKGRIFSPDGRHILILTRPAFPATDNLRAGELVAFMDTISRQAEQKVSAEKIHIAYMGGHRFTLDNAFMIKNDIKRTMAISIIAIVLLSLLVYSRPLLTLLTLVPAFFGGAFAAGVIGLLSPDISAISIGCGAMLTGIAVDYGIHFLYHVDRLSSEHSSRAGIISLLKRLTCPLLLSAGTTLGAFLTLQFSAIPGYHELGLFAALGITGAVGFSLIGLPLLLPEKPDRRKRDALLPLTNIFPPFFRWASAHRPALLSLTLLLSLIAGMGYSRLQFEGDVQKLNAVSPETKRDWDIAVNSFGDAISSTSVAVTGRNIDEALAKNDALHTELLRLRDQGLLKNSDSIFPLLPGRETQRQNRERWRRFWSSERVERLRHEIEQAGADVRIRPGAFTRFLETLPGPLPPLEPDNLNAGFLRDMVSNRISVNNGKTYILTNLKLHRFEDFPEVMARIEKRIPDAIVTNGRYFVQHMVHLIYRELTRLGGAALVCVALILTLYTRQGKRFFFMLLPLFLSLFWTFGFMGWIGVRINIMNCIMVIFIFGLVIDYQIFLDTAWSEASRENDTHLSHTGGAITISALTTIFGLGSLLFADHPALHSIGATALLGLTSGLTAVLFMMPLTRLSLRSAHKNIQPVRLYRPM